MGGDSMSEPFVSQADGYVKWLRDRVGHQLIYLVYTTVLVFDDAGRILVQRRYDFDWLGLPGGALEMGESLRDGARREVREETGLDVEIERLVGVFSHPDYNLHYPNGDLVQQWSVCVVARPVGGTLRADGNETLELDWLPVDEALPQFPPAYQAMVGRRARFTARRDSRTGLCRAPPARVFPHPTRTDRTRPRNSAGSNGRDPQRRRTCAGRQTDR